MKLWNNKWKKKKRDSNTWRRLDKIEETKRELEKDEKEGYNKNIDAFRMKKREYGEGGKEKTKGNSGKKIDKGDEEKNVELLKVQNDSPVADDNENRSTISMKKPKEG